MSIHEECGIFGIYLHTPNANNIEALAFEGILANQHRGEESAGIVVADGHLIYPPYKNIGLVRQVYHDYQSLPYRPKGHIALTHTRYSTTGSCCIENAAPFLASSSQGSIAIAHNGNLTNAHILKNTLLKKHIVFKSTTDSEVLINLISHSSGKNYLTKIITALKKCQGSFSLGLITKDTLIGIRDPNGIRPLYAYSFKDGFAISSETQGFNHLGKGEIIDIPKGTIVTLNHQGIKYYRYQAKEVSEALCGLEIAYLLRPDGYLKNNIQVNQVRRYLGTSLAKLYPPPNDIDFVTYIPESAKSTAEGYAEGIQKPMHTSLLKGRYGSLNGAFRGFINPDHNNRHKIAKGYAVYDLLIGKNIVLVDDSIIRGTTTAGVIKLLKSHGVKQIHLRIPWPPVKGFCPLGTDINQSDTLIYNQSNQNLETMRKNLAVDSLAFLTPTEFQSSVNQALGTNLGLCMGCTTGKYPIKNFTANKQVFESC